MALKNTCRFYCGTSNVELPVPNKTHFPEAFLDKSRLNYYASIFNTVEINSSFYRIPMRRTIEKWAADVPGDFRFTFKLWKGITHTRELVYEPADVARFMSVIDGVGDKAGCLLLQLPASIKLSRFQQLRQLLDELQAANGNALWRLAIEFRDKSWYNDTVYEMLERYKAAVVVHDMPASATPVIDMESSFAYLRFHGQAGDYRGSYEDDFLHGQGEQVRSWIKHKKTVFAYFNNTIGGAVQNALFLKGLH